MGCAVTLIVAMQCNVGDEYVSGVDAGSSIHEARLTRGSSSSCVRVDTEPDEASHDDKPYKSHIEAFQCLEMTIVCASSPFQAVGA
jgi:hypothetical protein